MRKVKKIISKICPKKIKKIKKIMQQTFESWIEEKYVEKMIKDFPNGFILLEPYEKREKSLGNVIYYSQFYQDMYLDNVIFSTKTKPGFFLDVGGNHPTYINNTYYFETKGWKGLAFEPQPAMNQLWKQERSTPCLQIAIGEHEGKVEFNEYKENYMSGISHVVDFNGQIESSYEVRCRALKDVLKEREIKNIDFMSLDVEGYEYEVLKGIDFKQVNIYCIVIENNKGIESEKRIRNLLLEQGYRLQARLWIDEIWIKKEIS